MTDYELLELTTSKTLIFFQDKESDEEYSPSKKAKGRPKGKGAAGKGRKKKGSDSDSDEDWGKGKKSGGAKKAGGVSMNEVIIYFFRFVRTLGLKYFILHFIIIDINTFATM